MNFNHDAKVRRFLLHTKKYRTFFIDLLRRSREFATEYSYKIFSCRKMQKIIEKFGGFVRIAYLCSMIMVAATCTR